MEGEFKAVKISNPNWLGSLGPQINSFYEKVQTPTITYETLYTYFLRSVQYGGERAEFWVVFKGEEPIAFAHWFVCDLPHRGVVFCDYMYSWNRMREPVELLLDEFIAFGKKKHAPIYKGTAINESVYRVFRKAASKRGFEFEITPLIDFIGRKK